MLRWGLTDEPIFHLDRPKSTLDKPLSPGLEPVEVGHGLQSLARTPALGMAQVLLKVGFIVGRQGLVPNHQQIFSIVLLGTAGEVEGAGEHRLPVNDHDLILGDFVG